MAAERLRIREAGRWQRRGGVRFRRIVGESEVVVYMEFGQQVLPQQVGGVVALVEKVGELHPSWRRWAGPASPRMTSLDASQNQDAVSKVGGGRGVQ